MTGSGTVLYLCLLLTVALGLSGCGQSGSSGSPTNDVARVERVSLSASAPGQGGQAFAYNHSMSLAMPRASINPRFERARDRCLQDAALHCNLLSASINMEDETSEVSSFAELTVTLPHDSVSVFEKSLLDPLQGEVAQDVSVVARSTQAENVTEEATDIDRRLAQLTDYRDRLTTLSQRQNLSAEDLIKIESELSRVQGELDQATAQKRSVGERINRERLNLYFSEHSTAGNAAKPIMREWAEAMPLLGDSTASALRFLIRAIPWLPIVAGGLVLLSWIWRIARRRPVGKNPTEPTQ